MEGLAVLAVVGFIGFAIWAAISGNQRRRTALEAIASKLSGAADSKHAHATGTLAGIPITLRYTTRGSGSSSESWTEIDATPPAGYPLSLLLRAHGWFDSGKIERGDLVDVTIGDPEFDGRFVIEAAPADVVRHLFPPELRAYLMSRKQLTIDTAKVGDAGTLVLRLSVRGWLEKPEDFTPALDQMAELAARVREAHARADQAATPAEPGGSPYRPAVDAAPARDARAARADEVAKLEATKAARAASGKAIGWIIIAIFIVVGLIIVAHK
ncbi:MAG: hypothetical protein IT370_12750 [Deltaproteobacteria bacterium]|nr:hypothetical protein [Deltaproteobacteria bacterium]